MSGGIDALALKEDDVTKMLAASTHIGTDNVDFQMEQYVYKRRAEGPHIINLRRTWEKLLLAARAICAIEQSSDVFVISSRAHGQRAVLKFAANTGATPIAGRFTPGAFTNQIQAAFREPRLLVVTDPAQDRQPITEASYVNIPVIAFCNTDSPLKYVDIAIPCNTKSPHSIGLMWWMLAREVLRFRGTILRDSKWDVVVDLFFYREPEEAEKDEQAAKEVPAPQQPKPEPIEFNAISNIPASDGVMESTAPPAAENWNEEPTPAAISGTAAPAAAAASTAVYEDWSAPVTEWNPSSGTTTSQWNSANTWN